MILCRATSTTQSYGIKVQSNSISDKVADAAIKAADLEVEIFSDLCNLAVERDKVIDRIHGLREVEYIEVLFRRYVEGKRLLDIAKECGFTYQYIRHLHGKALEAFSQRYFSET